MRLELENIGKLSKADIELNGITVIAGENNTGKSTVGKVLYSIFNGLYNIENRIYEDKINSIRSAIFRSDYPIDDRRYRYNVLDELFQKNSVKEYTIEALAQELVSPRGLSHINDKEELFSLCEKLLNIINISNEQYYKIILQKSLESEFKTQICNIYAEGKSAIKLTIKDSDIIINLENNKITFTEDIVPLATEPLYFDDPYVINTFNAPIRLSKDFWMANHAEVIRERLKEKNTTINLSNEIIINEKLGNIYQKLNTVCKGNLVEEQYNWTYQLDGDSKNIEINNISTGLKTFIIIKTLLLNGSISEKSTLILDEPEIHLHPEWQLVFAEIIVLLQKEFDMTILINTHSPYFLEALEVYSKKHSIDEKCKYYLAENTGDVSIIKDVTDNPELIYKKLARPFQILENERFSDD